MKTYFKQKNGVSRRLIALRMYPSMICVMICCIGHTFGLLAQSDTPTSGILMGDHRFTGSLTFGYRSLSVSGLDGRSDFWAERRYYEAYNLRSGIRLTDFNLVGEQQPGKQGLFDHLYLTASGIGDPFTSIMLRAKKVKGYDLRLSYTKADYFLNRNDSLYTGLHKFDMRREMISASLMVPISETISFDLRYTGNGRSGTMTTTFSPHVEGASAAAIGTGVSGALAPYSRDNFFWMNTPRNDWTNTVTGSLRLSLPSATSIVLGGGLRSFSQDITYSPDSLSSLNFRPSSTALLPNTFGLVGLNLRDERLYQFSWREQRSNSTGFVFADVLTKPTSWLSLGASTRMEFLTGDGSILGNWDGLVRRASNSAVTAPLRAYRVGETATLHQKLDRMMASFLATARITNQLHFTLNYRYESEKQDLTGDYLIAIDTSASASRVYRKTYRDSVQRLESELRATIITNVISPQLVYVPMANLNLRAGVQYMSRTPELRRFEDGASDSVFASNLSKKTTTFAPFLSVYYRPVTEIRLRGNLQTLTNSAYYEGTSITSPQYTRLVPDTRTLYSLSADIDLQDELRLALRWDNDEAKSALDLGYTNAKITAVKGDLQMKNISTGYTASLGYSPDEKTTINVSGTYRDRQLTLPSTFTRGTVIFPTPPFGDSLTALLYNNTIDRSIDVSLTTTALSSFRLMAGLMYLSSTGGGGMTPDIRPPAAQDITKIGGPYSTLDIHGQVQYQLLQNLALMVDYRYVMLNEQVTSTYTGLNNFAGNLLLFSAVIRW